MQTDNAHSIVSTESAPKAIGAYSQAVSHGSLVFLSGQIGLDPQTMTLSDDIAQQADQVFSNLSEVAKASQSSLENALKVTIYLTDMNHYAIVNAAMERWFPKPFPARAAVAVSSLPRNALIEADVVLRLP